MLALRFQVVGSKDGLGLSVTITLVMALIIGVAQPFALPQQNGLYTFCFACDLSGEGFAFQGAVWIHQYMSTAAERGRNNSQESRSTKRLQNRMSALYYASTMDK